MRNVLSTPPLPSPFYFKVSRIEIRELVHSQYPSGHLFLKWQRGSCLNSGLKDNKCLVSSKILYLE